MRQSVRRHRKGAGPGARRCGAALVETLVAVGILVSALALLAQLTNAGVQRARIAQYRTRGTLIAQERMEDLLAHRGDLAAWDEQLAEQFEPASLNENGEDEGFFQCKGGDRRAFAWKYELQDAEEAGLQRATVTVAWLLPGRKHNVDSGRELPSYRVEVLVPGGESPAEEAAPAEDAPAADEAGAAQEEPAPAVDAAEPYEPAAPDTEGDAI